MKNITITQEHLDSNPDLVGKVNVGDVVTLGEPPYTGCDKNDEKDPHHGEAGHYDENCNWIPSV